MKRIFLCILCVAVLLTGCGIEIKQSAGSDITAGENTTSGDGNVQSHEGNSDLNASGNTAVSGDAAGFDISRYDGSWYNEDYAEWIYKETGELMYNMGVWTSLDTKNNKVSIYDISSPPENRIALVETTYEMKDSKAEFVFDDDGWGNAGYGTIVFGNNELSVDITLTVESAENWEIFNGMLALVRDKNVIEVSDDDMAEVEYIGDDKDDGSSVVSGDNSSEVSGNDSSVVSGDNSSGMVIRLAGMAFDLEKQVDYKDLVNLTTDELGILENAVYAKHGYIFKTKKYTEYFSGFDWYDPSSEDVNSKLTKNDKSNAALIQKVERFYEKSVKLSEDEKVMIGAWHLGAGVGAGYSDMYRFYEDGTYKYVISQMVMDERELAHAGQWFVLDGYLYLRLEREGILVGGELVDNEHPGSASEKEIVDAEYMIRPLRAFEAVELKLDFNSDMIEKDYYTGVVIGNMDFYKLSSDPGDFTKDILDI